MERLLVLCISFLLILAVCAVLPVHGEQDIYDSVIRLHVIANSDSEYDQRVKLLVRDSILELDAFADADTLEQAAASAMQNEQAFLESASDTLAECGAEYGCRVEWGTEYYPTRVYEGVTYPAGTYRSLRIVLGEGQGKNWWCVLFPPLCLEPVSETAARTALTDGFTRDQVSLITGEDQGYVVKFRAIELWEGFQHWLSGT